MASKLEDSILERALKRGLVRPEDLAAIEAERKKDEDSTIFWQRYGSRISYLLERGLLNEEQVEGLSQEVQKDDTTLGGWKSPSTPRVDSLEAPLSLWKTSKAFPVRHWERFEDIRYHAEGGMAVVYKAMDPRLRRHVAIKLLSSQDPRAQARFFQEARSQAKIEHPNVCRIYEVGEVEGRPYLVMPFLEGEPIDTLKDQLTMEQKVLAMRDVGEAIHVAHREGLIHRDLKPSNILMERTEDGFRPIVVDFGLAAEMSSHGMTLTGVIMGTPSYMAPEQARGELTRLDRRTDVYALGATLYCLLTGRPPFRGETAMDTVMMVIQEEAPRPSSLDSIVPLDLDTIVMKCLEKEPRRRYESARQLAQDLQRYLDGESLLARPLAFHERLGRRIRKHPSISALIGGAVLVVMASTALVLRAQWRARAQAQLAQQFGMESERMEQALARAQMMPLHDLRPQKARIRAWMQKLESQRKRLGSVAEGPAHYAMGRTHLALGEFSQALVDLETAWRKGHRDPETAAALGQVHAALLKKEMDRIRKIQSREIRENLLQELDAKHRWKAIWFLQQGKTALPFSHFEGELAFLDGRYGEALALAQKAIATDPFLVEGHLLAARCQLAQGELQLDRGLYEQVLVQAERALQLARQAQMIARSLDEAFILASDAHQLLMECEIRQGRWTQESAQAARSDLQQSLVVDPDSPRTHERLARLCRRWADALSDRGKDPLSLLEEGISHAQAATRSDPQSASAHLLLAQLLRLKAEILAGRGVHPQPLFLQAQASAKKAVDLDPRDALTRNNLGNVHLAKAEILLGEGQDPTADLKIAIQEFQEGSRLSPRLTFPWINEGIAHRLGSSWESRQGRDPLPELRAARIAYEQAQKLNPRNSTTLNNLGTLLRHAAEAQCRQGLDPQNSLEEARQRFLMALEINPAMAQAQVGLGEVEHLMGQWESMQGQDPYPGWLKAERSFEKALAMNRTYPNACIQLGQVHLSQARFLMKSGRDPRARIQEARKAFGEALRINARNQEGRLGLASCDLLQGRFTRNLGSLASALQSARQAKQEGPETAEAALLMAEIIWTQAQLSSGPERKGLIAEARRALDESLKTAPHSPLREALLAQLDLLEGQEERGQNLMIQAFKADAKLKLRF